MRDVLVMQVEEVWCSVARFQYCQIFLPQVPILDLARMLSEQERQVGVVGVEQPEVAQVVRLVTGDGGKKRIQEVVPFLD